MIPNHPEPSNRNTRREATVRRFAEAWQKDIAPKLRAYWQDGEPLSLLAEMIHIDMKHRFERGQTVRVESYLKLFPDLAREQEIMMSLLATERSARCEAGEKVGLDEYRRRFPRLAPRLLEDEISTADHIPAPTAADSDIDPFLARLLSDKKRLGRYRLDKLLGAGAMGGVFQGWDDKLQRSVAVKVPQTDTMSRDTSARQRFLTEARAAAHLRHPNICPVFDVGDDGGVPYITMAFIQGTTLNQRLCSGVPIPYAQACEWVAKIAGALHTAHAAGIIHRDIKPANIMLDQANEPILMDFGLARRKAPDVSQRTSQGVAIGSPAYMAPEQVEGNINAMGPATDIYGLGVVLFQLLAGRLPFQGAVSRLFVDIVDRPPPYVSELCSAVPTQLADICMKALAKKPADRYATALEFGAALAPFFPPPSHVDPAATVAAVPKAQRSTNIPRTEPSSTRNRKLGRRHHFAIAVGLALVAVMAGVVVYWSNSDGVSIKDEPKIVQKGAGENPIEKNAQEKLSDRDIANWVLEIGGGVTIFIDGETRSFSNAALLPVGEFALHDIELRNNTKVTDSNIWRIQGARRLRGLSLEFTAVGDDGLAFVGEFTNLGHIGLSYSKATGKTIARMKPLTRLTSLYLDGIAVGDQAFAALADCKDLRILMAARAGLADDSMPVLENLTNLAILGIQRNSFTPKGLQRLARLRNLENLDVDGKDFTASEMAALAKLPKIQFLWIRNLLLREEHLSPLASLTRLQTLGLLEAQFDLQPEDPLRGLQNIKNLQLNESDVRDVHLAHIATLPKLESLDLIYTAIGDKELVHFEKSKSLVKIDLTGTKVTVVGVAALHSALPRCQIQWSGGLIEGGKP